MNLKRLTKPRFLFVYPLAGLLFAFGHITERGLRLGIFVILLGETLRLWANGYVGHVKVNWTQKWRGDPKIGRLITAGPYAFVRHPLYLGTALIGAGFCIVGGSLWLAAAALAGFLLSYHAKMAEEERLLHWECDAAYERYHAAVPQMIPTFRRYPDRQGRWSWQGLSASKEWKTAIWLAVVVILFYFLEEGVQEHGRLFGKHALLRVGLLVLAVALMATDGVIEFVRRRSQHAASV